MREHGGGRADRRRVASLACKALHERDYSLVLPQVLRARHAAGQHDHVVVDRVRIVERDVRLDRDSVRAGDALPGERGRADLDARAAQQIDDGDGLDFLEPFRQRHQDARHGHGARLGQCLVASATWVSRLRSRRY